MSDATHRLTPRQRECLRLVGQGRTSKEIAAQLGLSESTVSGYIAEAVQLLGARNRRHAAEMLRAAEGAAPEIIGGQSLRADPPPADPPPAPPTADRSDWRLWLPIRTKGATGNDLSILQRVAWIIGGAVGIAIGFGMLAVAIDVVSRLFQRGQ